jgi:signal transduction histidine kinase
MPTVVAVFTVLSRPWRRARTWRALVHVLLDLPLGAIAFSIVLTLLATSVGLLITFPLALPFAWLMFVSAAGFGRLERSRLRALLDVDIPSPHPPLPPGGWWTKLKARARTASRWREIGYCLLALPLGAVTFALAVAAWCGSLALVTLPFYVDSLPGRTAKFWLFEIGSGSGTWIAFAIGVVGIVLVAPWVTLALSGLDTVVARGLLGPSSSALLGQQVTQLEASRSAAVDSAEAERRRIERDLHDGAQQRLVALAVDLGRARERFDTDPDGAKDLVTDAHEEAKAALADLRGLVRGIHPAILTDRGLDAALSAVVARSPVPVNLSVDVAERPAPAVESTAYFVVTEALTNVAKHAHATKASVNIARQRNRLVVEVTDDGVGGADAARGTGLKGLAERVSALGGRMHVLSPVGGPTSVIVELPCAS